MTTDTFREAWLRNRAWWLGVFGFVVCVVLIILVAAWVTEDWSVNNDLRCPIGYVEVKIDSQWFCEDRRL